MPTTSIRIDPELDTRLRKLVEVTGRSKAWYIRTALEQYLVQEEWLVEAIQEGVAEADAGHFASEAEVEKRFERWGVRAGPRE